MDVQTIIERPDAYTEVGAEHGRSGCVYVHMEDADTAVGVNLTRDEALALMAALGQAVRAL